MSTVFIKSAFPGALANLVPTGPRGEKGDPGGNIEAIGTFAEASGLTIPTGTNIARTSGYSVDGLGGAYYVHDASVDSDYVAANPRSSFIDLAGRGFRLVVIDKIDVTALGAVLDNVTNDGPAVLAAIALSYALRNTTSISGLTFNQSGPPVYAPGLGYMGSTTLTLNHSFELYGDQKFGFPAGVVSGFRWDDGVTGIENPGRAGIFGLALIGGFAGTEGEHHGIHATFTFSYGDLYFVDWSGDGMNLDTLGSSGNVDGVVGGRVWAYNCRDALNNVSGSNNSIQRHTEWNIDSCRRWGINDNTFLGNGHEGHETAFCARTSYNDGVNIACSLVSSGGNRYFVIAGQETWCSTNAPSGTTADNQGWAYNEAGGVTAGIPAWVSGILVRAGGSYHCPGVNIGSKFGICYAEGGQPLAQISTPALVVGGVLALSLWKGNGSFTPAIKIAGNTGALQSQQFVATGYRGTDETVSAFLGSNNDFDKSVWEIVGSASFSNTARLRIDNGDLSADYGNSGAQQWYRMTGPATALTFGTSAPVPWAFFAPNLMVGADAGQARRFSNGAAAPTSGYHAQGEIFWNANPVVGQPIGWICTASGSPGTWVAMANL